MVSIDSLCWSARLEMLRQEVVLFAFYFWVAGSFWFVRSLNLCCAAGGEDHVVLFPGSDTFLCGLTDRPQEAVHRAEPSKLRCAALWAGLASRCICACSAQESLIYSFETLAYVSFSNWLAWVLSSAGVNLITYTAFKVYHVFVTSADSISFSKLMF